MRERERIREQLELAWAGPAWHGPSVSEVLAGVDAASAAARPLGGRHSIWEIVLHLTTWMETARQLAAGGRREPGPEEDWPPVGAMDAAAWRKALDRLETAHRALLDLLATLDEQQLDAPAGGKGYSVGFLLHGVVQHDAYHAGQIALLRPRS
ncbi:MAG TPA: DinB family protein [Terriglobales bacterium]|nr:DinB family protein [Terriglobales bacterium]